jgi:hypothetical protein
MMGWSGPASGARKLKPPTNSTAAAATPARPHPLEKPIGGQAALSTEGILIYDITGPLAVSNLQGTKGEPSCPVTLGPVPSTSPAPTFDAFFQPDVNPSAPGTNGDPGSTGLASTGFEQVTFKDYEGMTDCNGPVGNDHAWEVIATGWNVAEKPGFDIASGEFQGEPYSGATLTKSVAGDDPTQYQQGHWTANIMLTINPAS